MSAAIDPAVLDFFAGLPQQGPGRDAETIAVLGRIAGELADTPKVADLGCGTGRTTLALARRLPNATITAVDLAEPSVRQLEDEVRRRGLTDRVTVRRADMAEPPVAPGALDLIWSEGAAYIIGFADALSRWRLLLKPGGFAVVSECSWLKDDRPPESAAFWRENYPEMASLRENVARAQVAGYAVLGTHVLDPAGWEDYYGPIAHAIESGRAAHLGNAFAEELAEERTVYALSGQSFGYVFYVLRSGESG